MVKRRDTRRKSRKMRGGFPSLLGKKQPTVQQPQQPIPTKSLDSLDDLMKQIDILTKENNDFVKEYDKKLNELIAKISTYSNNSPDDIRYKEVMKTAEEMIVNNLRIQKENNRASKEMYDQIMKFSQDRRKASDENSKRVFKILNNGESAEETEARLRKQYEGGRRRKTRKHRK